MKLLHSHFSQLLCRLPAVLVALVVATSIHPVESRASNIKTLRQQPIVMQGNLLRRVGSLALPVPLRMPSGLHPIALANALVDPSIPLSLFGVVISFYPAEEQRVYDWAKSYRLYYGAEAQAQLRHRKALWFVLDDTTPGGLEAIRLPISQMPVSPPVRWSMRGHLSIGQWVLGVEWSGRPSWPHSDDGPGRTVQLFVSFLERHVSATHHRADHSAILGNKHLLRIVSGLRSPCCPIGPYALMENSIAHTEFTLTPHRMHSYVRLPLLQCAGVGNVNPEAAK